MRRRIKHSRRVLLLLGFSLAVAIIIAPSAFANFGGKLVLDSCCVLRGNRAGIQAPSSNFSLPSYSLGAIRVSAERDTGTQWGVIQVGFAQTNDANAGECGSRSSLTHYWEYKIYGDGSFPYHCAWLDGTPLVYGATKLYTVYRKLESATGNTTTWQANIDGVQKLVANVSFDGATHVTATGELQGSSSGSLSGCYACAGSNAWQRTSAAGSTLWTTISSAQNINSDGAWSIGSLPAFNVSR